MKVPLTPLRCLARAVDLYGHKEAVVCGQERFIWRQFAERCYRLASALGAAGVRQDDRVGYLSFNSHRLLEGYYGVPQARATVMPLNVRLTPVELGAILRHAEPRLLFYEDDFAPLVAQLRQAAPSMRTINLDREYEEFLAGGTPEAPDIFSYDEDSIAELFYTSGSTGTPKGVMLSHRTLYLHAISILGCFYPDDSGVELHTIPLFHANGWGRPQTATLLGIKQVMVRRFEPPRVLSLIQEEKATGMTLVPTMAHALLMVPDISSYDLSSMRQIYIGGAASSPELIALMERVFHCDVQAGYGLTETSPVVTTARKKSTVNYRDEVDRFRRQSTAGWTVPGTEVMVADANLQPVPRDMKTIGEVLVRGDNVMDGYYRDPEGTAAAVTDRWLHTGDMAVWDAEGYINIVDRKKDIIISGGENISSIEVEHVLATHPSVAEAAVVGAPDESWGEVPVAFVVFKPNLSCTEQELNAFSAERLAKFKLPRRYEFRTDPLPKGGTGKVLKRELREPFWLGKERRVQG
jgi:fatty-acyl-CoA synthase